MNSDDTRKAELFRTDVTVLRTSLVRHGLVEPSTSSKAQNTSFGPPSSDDLTAADKGEEQWAALGGGRTRFQALVGVDRILVGHVRAAEELRSALLSVTSSKESLKVQPPPAATNRQGEQSTSGDGRRRNRLGSLQVSPSATAAPSSRRQRIGPLASMAATLAMAAVRRGDRPFYIRATEGSSRRSGSNSEKAPQPTEGVSMDSLLDISATLFGSVRRRRHSVGSGIGGTMSAMVEKSRTKGDRSKNNNEKLVSFTVDVHAGSSRTLGITVKELGGGAVFVEDVRKLPGGRSGPAELAGILAGDVILGINYKPLEKGLVHTSTLLAEAIALSGFVKIQISRAVRSNTWRQPLPAKDCAIVTELMWRTAQLRKFGILTSAERYAVAALVLQRMAWEEGTLVEPPRAPTPLSLLTSVSPFASSMESAASALLDSLVLQVKDLREAISVRWISAKSMAETSAASSVWGPPTIGETEFSTTTTVSGTSNVAPPTSTLLRVRYVLRVEDIGTGREWLVFPQYSDFSELYQELLTLWPPIADLPFPARRPMPKAMTLGSPIRPSSGGEAAVEERGTRLEAWLDGAIALLGIYASIDSRCSGALSLCQAFLGRPKDLVSAELALSPALCDQKRAELLLYKLLNQVDSPAARMKNSLMVNFEDEAYLAPNVDSLMTDASSRLRRLQDFVVEQHEEQLSSSTYDTSTYDTNETKETTIRKAIRRQVELSLYLPLRRCLWKELKQRLQGSVRKLSRAIRELRQSSPAVFGVESPGILASSEWGPARESMGHATRTVLPTDQIDGLRRAAEHITALHASLQLGARRATADERCASNTERDNGCAGTTACSEGESRTPYGRKANRTANGDGCLFTDDGENGSRKRGSDGELSVSTENTAFRSEDDMRRVGVSEGGNDGGLSLKGSVARDSAAPAGMGPAPPSAQKEQMLINERFAESVAKEETRPEGPLIVECTRGVGCASSTYVVATENPAIPEAPLCAEFDGVSRVCISSESDETRGTVEIDPTSSWESIGTLEDKGSGAKRKSSDRDGQAARSVVGDGQVVTDRTGDSDEAMGADDFLPLFSLVLVHSAPLDLLLLQTLLTNLMDLDGSLSEAGYLVATLEAAIVFINQVHSSSCKAEGKQDISP